MDKRQVKGKQSVVMSSNMSEVLATAEKTLDLVLIFVGQFVVFLRVSLGLAAQNDGKGTPIRDMGKNI